MKSLEPTPEIVVVCVGPFSTYKESFNWETKAQEQQRTTTLDPEPTMYEEL